MRASVLRLFAFNWLAGLGWQLPAATFFSSFLKDQSRTYFTTQLELIGFRQHARFGWPHF